MRELEGQIRAMYADIEEYGGDFGDSVGSGTYDPYVEIRSPRLTPFEKTGVSVALLVYLTTAIDNSTYDDALANQGRLIRSVIAEGLLDDEPAVLTAANSFLESEDAFYAQLRNVYDKVVREQG